MKRWWGIRHIRYCIAMVRFNWWWNNVGRFYGAVPASSDIAHLNAIWRGEQ